MTEKVLLCKDFILLSSSLETQVDHAPYLYMITYI